MRALKRNFQIKMTNFQNLNLDPKILSALESKGYTTPTPIQEQSIPHILEGKDILGIAQTGTGKTASFSLPIIQNLAKSAKSPRSNGMRALILTPTRELATQIAENIELYGKNFNLRYAVIFGGVSEKPQITTMQRGVDILIATPGRLLDLANQGYIRFMDLEIFVLDEADRMLDMGFINDIKKIITKLPQHRQSLFFSATMPQTIADLANSILNQPVKVEVTPASTTVERIDQKINFVHKANKLSLLKRIIKDENPQSVLVFSKTKHGANRIVEFLMQNSISVAAIHGNKSQGAREKALGGFREGSVKVLIATDIAARGIDVPSISHVINFDIPVDPESYVHRIGRTARAGKDGIAISFCDPSEVELLRAIEKTINYKIPVDETHPYHNAEAAETNDGFSQKRAPRSDRNSRNFRGDSRNRSEGNSRSRFGSDSRTESRGESRGGRSRSDSRDEHRPDRRGRDSRLEERSDQGFNRGSRSRNAKSDEPRSSLLSFIGIGAKKRFNNDRKRDDNRTGENRAGENKRGQNKRSDGGIFGGLGWFGKKSESSSNKKSDHRGQRNGSSSGFSSNSSSNRDSSRRRSGSDQSRPRSNGGRNPNRSRNF